jgi:hypothetical protein
MAFFVSGLLNRRPSFALQATEGRQMTENSRQRYLNAELGMRTVEMEKVKCLIFISVSLIPIAVPFLKKIMLYTVSYFPHSAFRIPTSEFHML